MTSELKKDIQESLKKAKSHLEYSFNKVSKMDLSQDLDEEALETLESFSIRFARYSDLLVKKYFRSLALEKDPAYKGSVIDTIHIAEKCGWIEDAELWKRIRELRNFPAHEYEPEDYKALYLELYKLAPVLLEVSLDQ